MKFKEFYYKDFRPSYLEGVVRYPEQTDYVIEQNCKPINGKELSEIGLSDLNNLIKQCDDTYCIDRVKKLRSVLKRIMRYAYACRYTPIDLSAFELRRCRKRPETVQQLSFTAEQASFLTSGDSTIMKMFRFECLTGLRREEILALRWENVDLKSRRIFVCQTVVVLKGCARLVNDTKNHKFRYVELNESAYKLLLSVPQTCDFVFGNPRSKNFLSPRRYHEEYNTMFIRKNEEWKKTHAEGLPHLTPHKFRHTFASLLTANGADVKTVADLLGHTKLDTTNIYLHSYDDLRRQAVDKIQLDN